MNQVPPSTSRRVRVFISYSRGSEEHDRCVRSFAEALARDGVHVELDQFCVGQVINWRQWSEERMSRENSDFVLCICSERYRDSIEKRIAHSEGKGAFWEGELLQQEVYDSKGNSRIVPVLLRGQSPSGIPRFLQGWDFYRLNAMDSTDARYRDLIAALTAESLRSGPLAASPPSTRLYLGQVVLPTGTLIGRDDVKVQLHQALADDRISVLGLIAPGGTGKTALIFDWLSEIDTEQLEISHVFSWQFNDRVKKQNATSTDFFAKAFERFEYSPEPRELNIPESRAECLLNLVRANQTLFVLDGLEELQETDEPNCGKLTDVALSRFLQALAFQRNGHQRNRLIVLTSRLSIVELSPLKGYREIHLEALSRRDGATLLSELGVKGARRELEKASDEYGGHCLSLVLLGRIIANWCAGADVRSRVEIKSILPSEFGKTTSSWSDAVEQARRIVSFYEQMISKPDEVVLLQMLGLFLSPMSVEQRDYLVNHAQFARPLRDYSPLNWEQLATGLEQYGLLTPNRIRGTARSSWDTHPIIREHFRERLRDDAQAWQDAHEVLFRYFQEVADPMPDTLLGLAPLYRAVHHGCLAGKYREALEVYRKRILRDEAQGYSTNRLGAAAEDVAVLMRYLDLKNGALQRVQQNLGENEFGWLWGRMAFCQTCRGSLDRAIGYRRKQVEFCRSNCDPCNMASSLEHEAGLHILQGNLQSARECAREALTIAQSAGDRGQAMRAHCRLGAVASLRGEFATAEREFKSAQDLQRSLNGDRRILMDHGFYYRLFRLEMAQTTEALLEVLHDAESAGDGDQSWLAPVGMDLLVKAVVKGRLRDIPSADALFFEASARLEEAGFVVHMPYLHNFVAEFELSVDRVESARRHAETAQQYARDYKLPLLEVDSNVKVAEVALAESNAGPAHVAIERARELVDKYHYFFRKCDLELAELELDLLERERVDGRKRVSQIELHLSQYGRESLHGRLNDLKTRHRLG